MLSQQRRLWEEKSPRPSLPCPFLLASAVRWLSSPGTDNGKHRACLHSRCRAQKTKLLTCRFLFTLRTMHLLSHRIKNRTLSQGIAQERLAAIPLDTGEATQSTHRQRNLEKHLFFPLCLIRSRPRHFDPEDDLYQSQMSWVIQGPLNYHLLPVSE